MKSLKEVELLLLSNFLTLRPILISNPSSEYRRAFGLSATTFCFGMKKLFVFALVGLALWACNPSRNDPQSAGYEYFPLEKGAFIVYDVTATQYAIAQDSAVSRYQIKEVVADSFPALDGQTAFRIERFRRNTEAQAWTMDSVWTARRTLDKAIRTENNIAYVKLAFPTYLDQRWNGNQLNGRDAKEYRVAKINEALTVGTNNFPETVTVLQESKSTEIDFLNRQETYAKGIGLIRREQTELYYCQSANCFGQKKIEFGTRFIQQISSYGKE